jgi:hypothetical protein
MTPNLSHSWRKAEEPKKERIKKRPFGFWAQWFLPVIPVTGEVEIRKIKVQGWPRQEVSKTPSQPIGQAGGSCLLSQLQGRNN